MAATSIGAIVVEMVANTAKFTADLNHARGAANTAGRAIEGAFKNIGGAITAAITPMRIFTTLLGSGGFGLLIRNAVSAADRIAEMAQRIGISTDALQELSHAANLSGASIEDLENGLRFLNKNLGEAQAGSKAVAEAFRRIGVDPAQFRDAGAAIGAVADGILTLGNEAQRTEARLALFGRGGNQLAILLNEGSAGIAKFREEAQRLGLVIDREMLKQAQKLADDFDRLSAVIKTNLTRALIEVAPLLLTVAEKAAEISRAVAPLLTKLLVPDSVLLSQEQLKDRIVDVNLAIHKANTAIQSGAAFRAGQQAALLEEIKALEKRKVLLEGELEKRKALDRVAAASKPLGGVDIRVDPEDRKKVEGLRNELSLLAIADDVAKSVQALRIRMDEAAKAMPAYASEINVIAQSWEELLTINAAAKIAETAKAAEDAIAKMEGQQFIDVWTEAQSAVTKFYDDKAKQAIADSELDDKIREDNLAGWVAYAQAIVDEHDEMTAAVAKFQIAASAAADATTQKNDDLVTALRRQIDAFSMSERAAAIYAETLKLSADANASTRAEVEALAGKLFDLRKAQEESSKTYKELTDIVTNTTLSATDAMIDMAATGKASWADLATSVVKDINRIIVKMLLLKAINAGLDAFNKAGGFKGIFGGGGGSAGLTTTGVDASQLKTANIPAMAQVSAAPAQIIIENHGADIESKPSKTVDGQQIERLVVNAWRGAAGRGEFDRDLQRFGASRMGTRR
jgi:hypothetical protein